MSFTNANSIKEAATQLGFDHVAITKPEISPEDRHAYEAWVRDGFAAGMGYMVNAPEKRTNIQAAYPGVQSILTLGVSYYQGPIPKKPGAGYGRVARYAWGLDYHELIQNRLQKLMREIPGRSTLAVDTLPLLERALARSAGIGFIGKNTVLISTARFHVGSWIFLAEILMDTFLEPDPPSPTPENGCGNCTKCLDACPTNAFEKPYRLKADRCISYLTIENKGWIPIDMRAHIQDWVFGCDVCQDVCPYNARAFETRWPELKADHGVGPWVSLKDILQISDTPTFKSLFEKTPLSRSKRKGLLRNACVVAGNSKDESLVPFLINCLNDAEPLIRGHALWGLAQLGNAKKSAEKLIRNDADENVRKECENILSGIN